MAIAVYLQTTPAKLLQITVADSHIRMHIGGGLEMCRAAARGGSDAVRFRRKLSGKCMEIPHRFQSLMFYSTSTL